MICKGFQDIRLSTLGLGCMRLPVKENNNAMIDEIAAAEMVEYAMKNGVNYYDTAWGYHSGNSEGVMGKILEKYPRDSFYLASKFPGYDQANWGKAEDVFAEQLKRCRVDYFDFYLVHNVCEMNIDAYIDAEGKYGDVPYLIQQKANGRIRHLGFSAHASVDEMARFLDAYGEHMEFCQIQLNWLDWKLQSAKEKVELLKKHNIPVWVMEPLRGGKLANLGEEYAETLKKLRPEESIPAWAFRFLQTIPEVTMILSGMSNLEQTRQNIETFAEEKPLSPAEWDAILAVADNMLERKTLHCTACRYCTTHCPQELDIPRIIELYNEHRFTGGGFIAPAALEAMPEDKRPNACLGCRACEAVCPQLIKISEMMTDFVEHLK